jgi:predicted tellurium resistance membrane protein TerC
LRTLLIVVTVFAVVTAFIATHLRVVIGGCVAAMWLLEFASGPIESIVKAWPELKKPRLAKQHPTDMKPSELGGEREQ